MDASAYWRGCFLYDDFQNSHFPIITDHLFLSYHWFRRLFFLPRSIYLDQLVRGFFYYYFFLLYPWIFFSPTHPLVALYLVPNLSWFVTKFGFLPRCKKWFHLAANIWHRCQCTGHRSPAIKEGFAFELDGDWNRQQFYLLSSFSYAVLLWKALYGIHILSPGGIHIMILLQFAVFEEKHTARHNHIVKCMVCLFILDFF